MKPALVRYGVLALLVILTSCGAPPAQVGELDTSVAELETPGAQATPQESPSRAPIGTPLPPATPVVAPSYTPIMTEAKVTRIIDGDTIEVEIGGYTFALRYTGIDCPGPGEYGFEEATQANQQFVEGKTVQLEKDVSDVDGDGRLLRYVHVGDIFVNAELVRQGYATAWTHPPDVKYSDLFVRLAVEAKEAGRGLWAAPTPTSKSG